MNSSEKIIEVLDKNQLRKILENINIKNFDSVAIALVNSYINPEHEKLVARQLKDLGFDNIVLSHLSSSKLGYVDRANTAVVDAYLLPVIA